MDHSHMHGGDGGHGGMGHGGMGHGDPGHNMCSMNMLFTWSTHNLCVVFPAWRVTGPWSLLCTLIAVALLTAGYEAVRAASRTYELQHAAKLANMHRTSVAAEEKTAKAVKAVLYGLQVFYSFFIMLLFMTYNGWIMIAVGVGATLGYWLFGHGSVARSAACH